MEDKKSNGVNARFIEWPGLKMYKKICKSCINHINYYPQLKADECKKIGKIPYEYDTAEKSDCPYYKIKPGARPQDMPYTKEDEKAGKQRPEITKEPGKAYLKYDEARDNIRYYTVDETGQERWMTEAEEKELDEKTLERIMNLGKEEEK